MHLFWANRNHFERYLFAIASAGSAVVVLTYSWTNGWLISLHENWPLTYAAGAILAFSVVFYRLADRTAEERHSLEGAAAFFASLTLLGAGYWYFYERPGVPKLDVETTIEAWPIGNGLAVARIEVKLKNVGSTIISFDSYKLDGRNGGRDDRLKVDLGEVVPFTPADDDEVKMLNNSTAMLKSGDSDFELRQTYFWPMIAHSYNLPEGEIEAGETEQYYFKAVVPCAEGMILSSTVRLPKLGSGTNKGQPGGGQTLIWLAQAISEPINDCSSMDKVGGENE